jgi:acetyl-CoA carboxylase biotin carboxyl carrier protein
MADDSSLMPRPFDVQTVRYLVELMSQHDLGEIDLQEGDLRIRLRRGARGVIVQEASPPGPKVQERPKVDDRAATEPAKPSRPLVEIKSPGPGTFYTAPSPGAEPYVRVGSRVTETTVVGLLEAMKLFTDITADCAGVVVEIAVENQQAVEYGQVLFRVDPTG